MGRRLVTAFILTTIVIILSSCGKNKVLIEEEWNTFVDHWKNNNFEQMYTMLTPESMEIYGEEGFIDRYKKIYNDLGIEIKDIQTETNIDEQIDKIREAGKGTIEFSVDMETIAGAIQFEYEATLLRVEQKEEDADEQWNINWDPGFIFPQLKDDGEIRLYTESPERGEIIDRNKMPLAMNDLVYEVGIVPELLEEAGEHEKEEAARLLQTSVEAIDEALEADWVESHHFVPLGNVPQTEKETINELQSLQSVQLDESTGRVYPGNEATAHLIGYVGQITAEELESADPGTYSPSDIIGKTGLERLFEDTLKGEQGITIAIESEDEADPVILAEKEVIHGDDVQLTIDINIQNEIYEAYEDLSGTAAAIDPKTGETLALTSNPAYNPNELIYGNTQEIIAKLEDDPKLPMINRFTATYAPGSALKPITAAVGMNQGKLDPEEGLKIEGETWDNGEGWGDYQVRRVSTTDKPVDLADALIRSDNIYFAMQAIQMGTNAFIDGMKTFGFEEEFPFPYPYTPSSLSSSGNIDGEVALANTSYGQGEIEMSALHLAVAYTPFLNKGHLISPQLLTADVETEENNIWVEQIIAEDEAELIKDILSQVVTDGTAKTAKREELAISGKTGTAELKLTGDEVGGAENGWFVGFPTDDEDILIAMMVEGVEDLGGSGYAAEKVADILIALKEDIAE